MTHGNRPRPNYWHTRPYPNAMTPAERLQRAAEMLKSAAIGITVTAVFEFVLLAILFM